jgi:histidinol phosphatase-like enzyme (inositol monophosphatase family)
MIRQFKFCPWDNETAMPPLAADLEPRLVLAVEAAREAGRLTLEYFRRDDLDIELKCDDTPVTAADRHAEELLRHRIAAAFPNDAILGEEFPEQSGTSGFRWILDPIDGTKSFIHGIPLYSTLVGLECEGQSVLGVIRIPAQEECVYAAHGLGAWYVRGDQPPRAAQVSQQRSLSNATFLNSEVLCFDQTGRRPAYDRLQAAVRLTRTWGDGYGYLMVATGRADIMVDPIMAIWDAAALQPILEEAGGTFTDWHGNPVFQAGEGIATNGLLLNDVLDCLACQEAQ